MEPHAQHGSSRGVAGALTLLFIFAALVLAACGGSDTTESASPAVGPSEAAASPSVAASPSRDEDVFVMNADGKMLAYHDDERIAALPLRGAGRRVTLLEPVSDFVLHDPGVVPGWTRHGKALVVGGSSGDTMNGSRLYVISARGSGLSAVPGIETALDPAWRPQ